MIADAARTHQIGLGSMAIMLPMLAITAAAGTVSYDDITLAQSMFGLPDADRLERDLIPPPELDGGPEDSGSLPTAAGAQRSTIVKSAADAGQLPREAVRFERVRFHYRAAATGEAPDVLAGVDLELRAGSSTALVGLNGAGKSTLVSLLARLRDPTAGRITVDGVGRARPRPGPLAADDRADAAGPGEVPAVGVRQRGVRRA